MSGKPRRVGKPIYKVPGASMSSQNVSDDMLKECICNVCKCYLSVGPIRMIGKDMVCGRCEGDGVRVLAYEAMAKQLKFPCRYKNFGCLNYVHWDMVDVHEKACDFQSIGCGNQDCFWDGPKSKLQQHFLTQHSELLINEETIIKVNINVSKQMVFLYVSEHYVCKVYLIINDKEIKHSVDLFTNKGVVNKYVYNITFSDQMENLTYLQQKVQRYGDRSFAFYTNLDLTKIRSVFEDVSNLNVNIKLETVNEDKKIDQHDVECPICLKKMTNYIIILPCGHSICSSCSSINECPICRATIYNSSTRNYALENLIKKIQIH